jgi:hypothetical protein
MAKSGLKKPTSPTGPLGRPRSARPHGKRSTLSLRTTAELFNKLDREAKARGRPLSHVAEDWMEYAARERPQLDDTLALVCGPQPARLLMLLAIVISDLGPAAAALGSWEPNAETIAQWFDDPYCFDQMVRAVTMILEGFRPEGDRSPRNPAVNPPINMSPDAEFFQVGEQMAEAALLGVLHPNSVAAKVTKVAERLGEKFDPASVDRIAKNLDRLRRAKFADKSTTRA